VRILVYNARSFEQPYFERANLDRHDLSFIEPRLDRNTAPLAEGYEGVCAFTNDCLDEPCLQKLDELGVRLVALRCAGFNQVDVAAAERLNMTVARVPAYSPQAVAEHTVGLMLTLNRRIHRAYNRVREGNFSLDGLMGFDMHGKTVGVIGTGRIGTAAAHILGGFGCRLLAFDVQPNDECRRLGVDYVALDELLPQCDIITLHCPLTPETHHMIDDNAIRRVKPGVMLVNTSRGAVVDTQALIRGLKSQQIGSLGLDVYEEEADLFFQDLSDRVIQDDVFARLLTFPNVVITAHQAFFTREAVQNIADTTLANITGFERGAVPSGNEVTSELVQPRAGSAAADT